MGGVLLQKGDTEQAIAYYHRAIYGAWPSNAQDNRVQALLELVTALGKTMPKQAQAELLALVAEMPPDNAVRKRAGQLLLQFSLPRDAAAVFQEIVQNNQRDAEANAGLGAAEFAMGDFPAAQRIYREAELLNPGNVSYQERLRVVDRTLAIDPAARGLDAVQRFQRSRRLLEASVGSLDQCLAGRLAPVPEDLRNLADAAHKELLRHGRPQSYGDAAESNITLAQKLWAERIQTCGPAGGSEEALNAVMTQLAR
jgi:tetratricopeptide (TPR) repeat protein